jgi:hypothetical protein
MTASYQAEPPQGSEQALPFRKTATLRQAEMALQLAPGPTSNQEHFFFESRGKGEDRSRQNGLPTMVCKLPHVGKTINRNRGNRNFRDGGEPDLLRLQQLRRSELLFFRKGSGAWAVKRNGTWPASIGG